MARKNKRPQRKPQRFSQPPRPTAATPIDRPVAEPKPASGAGQARRERLARGRAAAAPLATGDASIPMERVPYFEADLRRIAIIAVLMLAILIIGSFLIR